MPPAFAPALSSILFRSGAEHGADAEGNRVAKTMALPNRVRERGEPMKFSPLILILALLLLVEVSLGLRAFRPFRYQPGAGYRSQVYEDAPGGGGEKLISDSGWQRSYLSEEDIHRLAFKIKMWNFSLLAVNTLGILWIIRRLRATARNKG
jgi:hypothetical protein